MKPRKSENWLKNGEKTAKFGPESFKMSEKMKQPMASRSPAASYKVINSFRLSPTLYCLCSCCLCLCFAL